ncbi:MAG TPA: 2-phospho-L-lactate guanylyltransferase [Solirubrobacteraceae bacterium]|jgi:2-phospho-L-lactate/phosphoenolpyruvate guanylyltransferase|nr:2-phospho-L-lactate guanylyltransferase [Solirubrobacteraceae bacterium]
MRTFAVLPIKNLDHAKQRLSPALDPMPRRALVEAMFSDTLVALRRCTALAGVVVVSSDSRAQRIAEGYGATVIEDRESGHSEATMLGIALAAERGAERALLLPADCPLIEPGGLDRLATWPTPDRAVLVVPDRHGTGTNALLLQPPDVIAPAFGEGSHARHLGNARAAGITAETVEIASLALDIDTPDDLAVAEQTLADSRGGAAHTRGMLTQLTRSRA